MLKAAVCLLLATAAAVQKARANAKELKYRRQKKEERVGERMAVEQTQMWNVSKAHEAPRTGGGRCKVL